MNNIQCCECGKFCKPFDWGIMYGSLLNTEPPDPSYFCEKCVDKQLKQPEKIITGCWYIKPDFVGTAKSIEKSIIRHQKKKI